MQVNLPYATIRYKVHYAYVVTKITNIIYDLWAMA